MFHLQTSPGLVLAVMFVVLMQIARDAKTFHSLLVFPVITTSQLWNNPGEAHPRVLCMSLFHESLNF